MNELIEFLIKNDITYHEVTDNFIYFFIDNTRYAFNFNARRVYITNGHFSFNSSFDSLEFKDNVLETYIEIYINEEIMNSFLIWIDDKGKKKYE